MRRQEDKGRSQEVQLLLAERPRNRFVRGSLYLLLALIMVSWTFGDLQVDELFSTHRLRNLNRFLSEVRPFPLHGKEWDWGVALSWAQEIFKREGLEATLSTLGISVVAILLAGFFGSLMALPAARNLACSEPFLPEIRPPPLRARVFYALLAPVTRFALILLRAIPEYIWAFILLAVMGPSAWPAIVALAIHNTGILGRLQAETVENVNPNPLSALRGLGGKRSQLAAVGLLPLLLPRGLLYLFYRWETCVREATVLGMLGFSSLGFWITDARARLQYDRFLFFVLLGAAVVLIGDFISAFLRRIVRKA